MDNQDQSQQDTPIVEQPKQEQKTLGPIIGLIIILLLIIIGSLYFFRNKTRPIINTETPKTMQDEGNSANNIPQNNSDSLSDIEADLDASSVSDIDADLNSAEKELDNL